MSGEGHVGIYMCVCLWDEAIGRRYQGYATPILPPYPYSNLLVNLVVAEGGLDVTDQLRHKET